MLYGSVDTGKTIKWSEQFHEKVRWEGGREGGREGYKEECKLPVISFKL